MFAGAGSITLPQEHEADDPMEMAQEGLRSTRCLEKFGLGRGVWFTHVFQPEAVQVEVRPWFLICQGFDFASLPSRSIALAKQKEQGEIRT
jgi:hypothetical protein